MRTGGVTHPYLSLTPLRHFHREFPMILKTTDCCASAELYIEVYTPVTKYGDR